MLCTLLLKGSQSFQLAPVSTSDPSDGQPSLLSPQLPRNGKQKQRDATATTHPPTPGTHTGPQGPHIPTIPRCSSPIPPLPSSSASHGAPWHRGALSAAHTPQPGQGLALWLGAARGRDPVEPRWGHRGCGEGTGAVGAGARGWGSARLGGATAPLPCKPLPAPAH